MKKILDQLANYHTLSQKEAREILLKIGKDEYNQAELSAFLTLFMIRPITVDELAGFRSALMELCIPVELSAYDGIDLCGTGGDGKNTFNISTLSAFVVAACGQHVVKHGNYSVSSSCGSSDVLEHIGYEFTNEQSKLEKQLETCGICFLHAPKFHPAMRFVGPVRKQLGVKTFFNMLGPLVNPARPKKQLAGVFSHELARIYTYLLQDTDVDFSVIYDLNGYDECSLTGSAKVFTRDSEAILHPADLDLPRITPDAIKGGQAVADTAADFVEILKGNGTEAQNAVIYANAALALRTAGKYHTLSDAKATAEEALQSGKAYAILKKLITN